MEVGHTSSILFFCMYVVLTFIHLSSSSHVHDNKNCMFNWQMYFSPKLYLWCNFLQTYTCGPYYRCEGQNYLLEWGKRSFIDMFNIYKSIKTRWQTFRRMFYSYYASEISYSYYMSYIKWDLKKKVLVRTLVIVAFPRILPLMYYICRHVTLM